MRFNGYTFPADISDDIKVANGCKVHLKTGGTCTPCCDVIPDDKRELIDSVESTVYGLTVSRVKELMKEYGGYGWSDFTERDGTVYSSTPIILKGRNTYKTATEAFLSDPGELVAVESTSDAETISVRVAYTTSFKTDRYYKCSEVVRKVAKKFRANPAWVWDVCEDEFGTERGRGDIMTQAEAQDLEEIIFTGMNE